MRPLHRLAIPALAGALFAAASLASAPAEPPVYDPDPTQPEAGTLQGETWTKEAPTAALALTRIDDATRTGFVRRRSGLEFDPFASVPGHEGHFVAFHVLIENRGEARLVFQPQACRMETSYRDSEGPVDYPTIVTAFAMSDRPAPAGLDRIRAAILDGEIILYPGETRDGLLVYRTLDPRAKRYHVEVTATLASGEAIKFTAHFKKRKT